MSAIPIFSLLGNVASIATAQIFLTIKVLLSLIFQCDFIHIPSEREDFAKIQAWLYKYHKQCSWYIDTDSGRMPGGIVIGWKNSLPFLAWITGNPESNDKEKGAPKPCKDVFLITWIQPSWAKQNCFEKDGTRINQSDKKINEKVSDKIKKIKLRILQPTSAWVGDRFREMKINVFPVAKKWQLDVFEQVKNTSNNRIRLWQTPGSITLLQGPPGTGKTEAAKVIAAKMNATLVPDFDPTRAGHWLASIVKIAEPTEEKPLVIVMDEVDSIIKKILEGESFANQVKWLFLQVYNKKSWNQLFDNLHKNFEHIHIIMTSNTTIDDLKRVYGDKWDASLLRIGRIDNVITVGEGYTPEDRENILPVPIEIDYKKIVEQKFEKYDVEESFSVVVESSKEE